MQADTQIEDVILSKAWIAEEHAQKHTLMSLLACIASLDEQASTSGGQHSTQFCEAVEDELRRVILIEHRQRASALESEDCALTTALILLLRMQGKLQASF